jgi:hypothetical protein
LRKWHGRVTGIAEISPTATNSCYGSAREIIHASHAQQWYSAVHAWKKSKFGARLPPRESVRTLPLLGSGGSLEATRGRGENILHILTICIQIPFLFSYCLIREK